MSRWNLSPARARQVSIGALALAVLLFADVLYQTGMHIRWRRWIAETARAAEVPSTQPASQPASQPAPGTQPASRGAPPPAAASTPKPAGEIHAALRKRNIFTEPPQKGHGMRLTGVLGRVALFANRGNQTIGIEEGQSASGIKVVSIKAYEVVIEYQGKPETMKLFP